MRRCWLLLVGATILAGCGGFGRRLSPIRLEPIVTLGATSGDGAIATTPLVSPHHPDGFWVVTPASSAIGSLPLVYGDDGAYLGSLHGDSTLAGSFSGPMFTRFGPGDSIWVFDNSGRVLVFGPRRNYVRSLVLPTAPSDARILPDNRLIARPETAAAVKLFDAQGTFVRDVDPNENRWPSLSPTWIDAKGRLWRVGETTDRHFDTVLEVRDLNTGRLIATTRLDGTYNMAEPGVLVHTTRTSAGWQRAELSRIMFTEPSSRQ